MRLHRRGNWGEPELHQPRLITAEFARRDEWNERKNSEICIGKKSSITCMSWDQIDIITWLTPDVTANNEINKYEWNPQTTILYLAENIRDWCQKIKPRMIGVCGWLCIVFRKGQWVTLCVLPDMLFRGLFIASRTKSILESCTLMFTLFRAKRRIYQVLPLARETNVAKRIEKTMPMAPLWDLAQLTSS